MKVARYCICELGLVFCLLTRTQNLNLEVINGDPKGGVGGTEEGPRRALEKCHKRGAKWGWPDPPTGGEGVPASQLPRKKIMMMNDDE